jgi:peptide/nickel transport system substrate-binding protein
VKRPIRTLAATLAAVGVAAAVVVASGSAAKSSPAKIHAGGTLNVGWEQSFGFTDNLDPTGEYLGDAFGILDNLLVRTLVGYNHTANAAGNQIVPDLATTAPKPTNGGKTYTFHLKPGIKFGPPVNRAVTSHDLRTAGSTRSTTRSSRAGTPTPRGRRSRSPASRRRTTRRSSST